MKFNRNDLMRTFTFILLLVICSLMLPPVPVLAADPDDIDWPDFSKLDGKVSGLDIPLEMPPFSFVGTNFSSWVARYKEIRADKSERRLVITISYWPDPSKMFENSVAKDTQAQLDANPGVIPIPEIYRDGEDFRIIELENPSSCEFAYLYYSRRTGYGGQRNFRYRENYNINVSGSGGSAWGSDARFKEAYDQAEQYAKNAVDGLVAGNKGILTLQYYDPILVTSKDGFKGCDIVATLKDKNGKGITGKEVYFFKDLRTGFKEVFRLPVAYGQTSALNINLPQAFDDVPGYVKTSVAVTNENGVARWNYLESLVIDWDPLINFKPASSDESLETRIIAVVFNKNPNKSYPAGEGPQIEYAADIPVAFKGVAAITSRNTADSSQKSVIKVGPPGGEKVVVTTLPYYLHAGEEVFIDSNTIVTIKWISGHAITANVKKDFKDGGTIYIDYKDAGWYRAFDQYVGGPDLPATYRRMYRQRCFSLS